jgi:DNA-binding NarL/FixJ family response regulator
VILNQLSGQTVVLCLGDLNQLLSHSFNAGELVLLKGLCSAENEAFALVQRHQPQLLICHDQLLPGNGIQLIKRCKAIEPKLKTLLLVSKPASFELQVALKAGVDAICKADRIGQGTILQALKNIAIGSHYIDQGLLNSNAAATKKLSPRQLEVLQELCQGASTKQVAKRLGITENTAKGYEKQLYEKLDVSGRMQAVMEGLRLGLLQAN